MIFQYDFEIENTGDRLPVYCHVEVSSYVQANEVVYLVKRKMTQVLYPGEVLKYIRHYELKPFTVEELR